MRMQICRKYLFAFQIFGFFGNEFMAVLGGSLLQVLMPLVWFVAARFWGKDAFAGALCLWLMGSHELLD